jgi:CheY-like chemotaxis protein
MKILVVEDHAGLAEMTCRVLQDVYDHEVARAATGAGAIEMFGELRPELMLVDIHLPDMNGYDLARRIRELPFSESTLLVALTGFGNIIDDGSANAAGFDAHFRKPMDFDLLPTLRRRNT